MHIHYISYLISDVRSNYLTLLCACMHGVIRNLYKPLICPECIPYWISYRNSCLDIQLYINLKLQYPVYVWHLLMQVGKIVRILRFRYSGQN